MNDSHYSAPVHEFLEESNNGVIGALTSAHNHQTLDKRQIAAWEEQIKILQSQLCKKPDGYIFIEFSIPRMGKRADVVLISGGLIFVIEFKVWAKKFDRSGIDQVHGYALDLKNFHLGSHDLPVVPVLIATEATSKLKQENWAEDNVAEPLLVGKNDLALVLDTPCPTGKSVQDIDVVQWRSSGYRPTPTIIEAAEALYRDHTVDDIYRSDADAKNIQTTFECITKIIEESKRNKIKSICFITGVPGAGKTLVGLNIAAKRAKGPQDEHAVFLSGNGPLVDVLQEALAEDQKNKKKF